MNILLTNDDGIKSKGLLKLAEVLRSQKKHKLTIIAPAEDRSGVSHCLTILRSPMKLLKLGDRDYTCSGTPADCVIAGLMGALPEKPDLVLSGINRGANLGTDLIYSGTAAAARQAGLFGVPGIALSLTVPWPFDSGTEFHYWDMAAAWAAGHLEELAAFWRVNTYVNVNIPNSPEGPLGMKQCWPAHKNYNDRLLVTSLDSADSPDGGLLCALEGGVESVEYEEGSDCDLVSRNYVSVSTLYNYPAVLKELCPKAPAHSAVAARKGALA